MVIGRGNGFWVIIVKPWAERTYHKSTGFKSLVYRWRLVHASRDWFKIMDGKSVRKVVTVPTYHIKRMRGINELVQHPLFFDFHQKLSFFIKSLKVLRQFIIPFTERGVFQKLSEPVS